MSAAEIFTAADDEILDGIAEILWATAWADHVEECGCQSLSGVEITDVMPPIPSCAKDAAYALASNVVERYGCTLDTLYHRALESDAQAAAEGEIFPARTLPKSANVNSPRKFGEGVAHEAIGAGCGWQDDHFMPALPGKHFHIETYELQQFAEDECGCMDHTVQARSSDEYVDGDGNTHSEPGPGRVNTVYLDVWCSNAENAEAWANKHQSADGSNWECRDNLAYNIVYDRPGLIDDLRAEGYDLDLSEYTPDE